MKLLYLIIVRYFTEISFPSSLFALERKYVHNRAKQLGYHSITKKYSFKLNISNFYII